MSLHSAGEKMAKLDGLMIQKDAPLLRINEVFRCISSLFNPNMESVE